MEREPDLAHFFYWSRGRALRELEARLQADPTLDANWTFSDIMQELLTEYRRGQDLRPESAASDQRQNSS